MLMRDHNIRFMDKYWQFSLNYPNEPFLPRDVLLYLLYLQCVFLLDPNYPSYVKGEKQYGFNFIEVAMEMREEG